jgi:hypothetical protein
MIRAALILVTASLVPTHAAWAQGAEPANPTRTTTIAALTGHPLFFSRQRVRVQGELVLELGGEVLTERRHAPHPLAVPAVASSPGTRARMTGTFWDVGRLQPDDGAAVDFRRCRVVLNRDWPSPGRCGRPRRDGPGGRTSEPSRAIALDLGN